MFEDLKASGTRFQREVKVYQFVLRDRRTPRLPKILLGLAVGYLALPFDIIPDFLPVIGHLDDLVLVPGLVCVAMKLIPKQVFDECRTQVWTEHSD
ncbi:MAG: YkvA family protein [Nitrospirales bacterium]